MGPAMSWGKKLMNRAETGGFVWGADGTPLHVDQVADGLEGVEADAEG